MVRRWCGYLAVLLGMMVFYIAYQQWLAWLLMMAVIWLPMLSLVVSLPAMLTVRLRAGQGCTVPMGTAAKIQTTASSCLPRPRYWCKVLVTRSTTGENWLLSDGDALPTAHCGRLKCQVKKGYVYDYLGMFRIRVRRCEDSAFILRPFPLAMKIPTDLDRYMGQVWKPKPGGGFAENHELRLYRPGDGLNQVHWKLTAKTGRLIIREAMEPADRRMLLTMDLKGNAEELDQKLGKLLWMGKHLLGQGLRYEIHVLTGKGIQELTVTSEQELERALDRLLCQPVAQEGSILDQQTAAAWRCHIGGGMDEA